MNRFVLDCSMTMAWCLEDEANDRSEKVLDSLETHVAMAPGHWPLEIANVLTFCERRGRISTEQMADLLRLLAQLAIVIDDETANHAMSDTLAIAREHRLTAYDAAYLELALRKNYPLASLDGPLNDAAASLGIALYDG